jgi:aconitate decarboxylase
MHSATFIQRLAEHVSRIDASQLPEPVIRKIKGLVFDSLGGILAAWHSGTMSTLVDSLASAGGLPQATLWTDGRRLPAPTVALILGVLGSRLEFSSSDRVVVPALVMGEVHNRSGLEVIGGIVAGLDAGRALKQLLASEIEAHKLHWPGQVAGFSAAATACKMSRADATRTAAALSLSACLAPTAPFESFIQGAGVKDLYGGWGLMLGILAEQLSMVGCGGPLNLIEGGRGLGQAWLHRAPTAAEIDAALPTEPASGAVEITHKFFATCTCAHSALSAVQNLLQANPFLDTGQIETVEVLTYDYALSLSSNSPADSQIAAQVNIPYLVAAMLIDGELGPEQTNIAHLTDPQLRQLAARVRLGLFPGAQSDLRHRSRPARVTLSFKDGSQVSAQVQEPFWGSSHPATDAELEQKFRRLADGALPAKRLDEVVDMVWQLESLADVTALIDLLPVSKP